MTATYRNSAARLIAQEMSEASPPGSVYDAADRVCQRMHRRLTELVTAEGYQALLDRAVHQARAEFPFLPPIRSEGVSDACLGGLRYPVADVDPALNREALVAVLGGVLGLLSTFIGEELASRVLRDVWPGASYGHAPAPLKETRT